MLLPELHWIEARDRTGLAYSSRHGVPIELVVVHRWGGGSFAGVVAEFQHPGNEASAHVVYAGARGLDAGKCVQMVRYRDKAWTQAGYNPLAVSLECADAIWDGRDPHGLAVSARIVAFWLHHFKLPVRWVRGTGLLRGERGLTRHYDLGRLGGGHTDPTTDLAVWAHFCRLVAREYRRGGFRERWGT